MSRTSVGTTAAAHETAGEAQEAESEEIYAREGPGMEAGSSPSRRAGGAGSPEADYTISWRNPSRLASRAAAWGAASPEQDIECYFAADGLRVVRLSGNETNWELSIRFAGHGREGEPLRPAEPADLYPSQRRIVLDRGPLREWYENGPGGLHGGLDISDGPPFPPAAVGSPATPAAPGATGAPRSTGEADRKGLAVVELVFSGDVAAWEGADFQTIGLTPGPGEPALYLALDGFTDARGERLRARIELARGGSSPALRILFADQDALYPVRGAWSLGRLASLQPVVQETPWEVRAQEIAAGETGETSDTARQRRNWWSREKTLPFDTIPAGAYALARRQREAIPEADASSPLSGQQSVTGNHWFSMGPSPITQSEGRNSSGRVRAVAFDPSDSTGQTIYIGAATGGVWKTTNGGVDWKPLTDSQPSLAVQTIALDPQDPQIVYAGTGEDLPGAGLFRSTDGGVHWSVLGASTFDWPAGGAVMTKVALVPGAVRNPLSQRIILVGAENGLYRSEDGGGSWIRLYDWSGYTDIVVDPRTPTTVYMAKENRGIYKSMLSGAPGSWTPPLLDTNGELPTSGIGRINLWIHDAEPPVLYAAFENSARGSELKGVWKTSDGGAHWTRVTGLPRQFDEGALAPPNVFESETNDTLATADPIVLGQVVDGEIAASTDSDFYSLTLTGNQMTAEVMADRAGTGLDPVLRLYDASGNLVMWGGQPIEGDGAMLPGSRDERITMEGWKVLAPGTYYLAVSGSGQERTGRYQLSSTGLDVGCQCWYDQALAVDPSNPATLYLGLVRLLRSTDGGVNWTDIHNHGGSNWIHADIHTVAFRPGVPSTMVWGSDGGVFKTFDGGDTWQNLNQTLTVTQAYPGAAQHPTDAGFVLFGAQDNGTVGLKGGVWSEVDGGDGLYTAIADSQTWYVSNERLLISKTIDGGAHVVPKLKGLGRHGALWAAPFIMDPNNTRVLIAGGGDKDAGGTVHPRVYRTADGAENWFPNSQDLLGSVRSLAIAPSDSATCYAGTVIGRVWRTRDEGATNWTDVTPAGVGGRAVTDIAVDPLDRDIVYVTVGGFSGTQGRHVYRTINGGDAWDDISAAPWSTTPLPDLPMNAIVVDPGYRDTLFVGTDYGIYRTTDAGQHWETFDFGLPKAAQVTDLVLNTTARPQGILRATTYGRGVWELRVGNDECANAQMIGDGSWQGTTRGASGDGSADCVVGGSPDVWYRYTATCDGELSLDTCGSGFDTIVSLHDPSCPGTVASQLDCNDECGPGSCGGGASCSLRTVQAGESFLIRVAGRVGATGDFRLNVSCDVPNDACDDAIGLYVPSAAVGGTTGAATDLAPACQGIDDTAGGVWYTVIGTGRLVTASTCGEGTNYDTRLSVYCAGCGGHQCVAANDDACSPRSEVTWCSAPGRVYHLLVHGGGSATGRYVLTLSDGASCGPLYPVCAPGNDLCARATPIDAGDTSGDTTGAGTDGSASCAPSSGDVWYEYTPSCHGFATIGTCDAGGTLGDTVVSVQESCPGREIVCSDDACGVRSQAKLAMTADLPLAIRVAGYGSGAQGTFPFSLDLSLAPLAVPPSGLYIVDGEAELEDHLVRIDPVTGAMTDVGPLGATEIAGLAYASNTGQLYGIDDGLIGGTLVTIDPRTGAATAFASTAFDSVRALAYDVNHNRLFAADTNLDQLVEFNPYSGAGRTIGMLGFGAVTGLAFDPGTDTLYGSDVLTDQLLVIDMATGAGTAVGPFGATFDRIEGLGFDTVTRTLFGIQMDIATSAARIVRIDTTTGTATQLGGIYFGLGADGLEFIAGLPDATAGKPYDGPIPVAGGCPQYRFSDYTGLPPGLSGDLGGRIGGTTTAVGDYSVGFVVTDTDLSTPPASGMLSLHVHPENDSCANALRVSDGGQDVYTVGATTDGPDEPGSCSFFGDTHVGSDVWFCYQATCTGTLTASLCGSSYDTKLAIYGGCGCPAPSPPLACNDDFCGVQSEVAVAVTAGQSYAVRVGGYNGARGAGVLSLSCSGTPSGGCCIGGGCSTKTGAACLEQDGTYLGDGSSCAPDADGDGLPDSCDGCPVDVLKTAPGGCGCGVLDQDADADGLADCLDTDADGDGVDNADDTAPGDRFACRDVDADQCDDCTVGYRDRMNDGADADADGYCDLGDCDDADAEVWRAPSETTWLMFADETTITWEPPLDPGSQIWRLAYDTLLSEVPWTFEPAFCLESDDGDFTAQAPQAPPAGAAFFYLSRAQNSCGEGSLGSRSDGTSLSGPPCP